MYPARKAIGNAAQGWACFIAAAICIALILPAAVCAHEERPDRLRIAFWRIDLDARGPGYALRDILAEDARAVAKADLITHLAPDILVLSGIDHDHHLHTLGAFRALIAARGHDLPHVFAFPSNAGVRTGLDMTGDGRDDTADDTHGFGRYAGERGLGILSRWPFDHTMARDFSGYLWRDLPGARLPDLGAHVLDLQRLSSTGHWDVPVLLGPDRRLHLLVYQAGPPVFGRHPDRNLWRNHDETRFWTVFLNGALPMPPPFAPVVLVGGSNLDPVDGDGVHGAMRELLSHPALQDPAPTSVGAVVMAAEAESAGHAGPHEQDTVHWPQAPGNLRVSYILPGAELEVLAAGVFWPEPGAPEASFLGPDDSPLSAHRVVWVDIDVESVPEMLSPN